jgi:serine protease inhibitor
MLDSDTAMVLVNTIYYKGIWKYKFSDKNYNGGPSRRNFYNTETDSVETDFMELTEDLSYGAFSNLGLKALKLPYKDGSISMFLILPNPGTSLSDIENSMTGQMFSTILDRMEVTEVDVLLPKFKIEFEADLNEPLQEVNSNFIIFILKILSVCPLIFL